MSFGEVVMPPASNEFTVGQTHGANRRTGAAMPPEIHASSNSWAWPSFYASLQRELPFEDSFDAVDDQLIILHLDGPVTVHRRVRKGESSRLIPPGGLFMVPGGMDFSVRLGGTLQTLHLYLRRALIEEVTQSIQPGDPSQVELLPRLGDSDPLIERLMLGVRDALHDDTPSAAPYVDYLGRAIAARLIRGHSSASPVDRAPVRLGRRHLGRVIDFMETNLGESIDLVAMAAVTGLSPSHFARQFRTMTGKAPHQYLMHLRIERAKRLLSETETPIVTVAFACGFANQEHLTRLFKRSWGIAPAAYRRTCRG
jgi:AraC family transcriptional regulator